MVSSFHRRAPLISPSRVARPYLRRFAGSRAGPSSTLLLVSLGKSQGRFADSHVCSLQTRIGTEAHATHVAMIDAARLANLKRDIKDALLNNKVIAFPIACRVAWHASGTFDARDGSGGSDGGTMGSSPSSPTPRTRASASSATCSTRCTRSTWTYRRRTSSPWPARCPSNSRAGPTSRTRSAGPTIATAPGARARSLTRRRAGRYPPERRLPPHGHVRQGHRRALRRARSGDATSFAPGTTASGPDRPLPIRRVLRGRLIHYTWKPREWDGKLQYTDVETNELMMLPTDIALKVDPGFHLRRTLRKDQEAFSGTFQRPYSRLLALGTKPARTSRA